MPSGKYNLFAAVMAGGQGTRFWPESTSKCPKQYLRLTSNKMLVEETLERFSSLIAPENRYIVTVKSQLDHIKKIEHKYFVQENVILEPDGRNTAPCILLTLVDLIHRGAKSTDVIAIVPSDHIIQNHDGFRKTLKKASDFASKFKKIVTIGIKPSSPHTGFGYIHLGEKVEDSDLMLMDLKKNQILKQLRNIFHQINISGMLECLLPK